MSTCYIESEALRVGVAPSYGARVVSLLDRRSGREWMTQGGRSADTGEDARYGGDEAVGWDECFPTVGTWDGTRTAWRRPLRDHGDLWGRPWRVDAAGPDAIATTYAGAEFTFTRALRVAGPVLTARYAVTNAASEPLPYLWALHALFAVEPGDSIELPGIERVRATYLSHQGRAPAAGEMDWAADNDILPFRLAEVQPPSSVFAGKFLVGGVPGGRTRLGRSGQWLEIAWDAHVGGLGIWLTYGAWPQPGGHQEAALEPTSAAADHLGEAIAAGSPPLAPGERREWSVTLAVAS